MYNKRNRDNKPWNNKKTRIDSNVIRKIEVAKSILNNLLEIIKFC